MITDRFNLLDVNVFAQSREFEIFKRLRDEAPVYFHPEVNGPGFYAVTRYDDVVSVLRNHTVFASGQGTQIANRKAEGYGTASVHNSDPPYHTHLRNVILPKLGPAAVKSIEPKVREIVNRLFDACPRGEPFDFVDSYAVKLPMMVIGHVLGVPEADQPQMVNWANTISDVRASDAEQEEARTELFRFFRGLVAQKRANPADDVATELTQAKIEGRPLTDLEIDAYFAVLSAAGNETTRFLISGGLAQLCQRPDDIAMLRRSPELIPAAIEEMVRWVTPVMQMRRTATEDAEVAGTPIRKGDKVVVYFASANRDERKFDDPESFIPTRKKNPHLGFGHGAHFCIGAHLARLESRIFFETLFERVSDIRLAGKPERLPSYIFHGYVRLPVVWN